MPPVLAANTTFHKIYPFLFSDDILLFCAFTFFIYLFLFQLDRHCFTINSSDNPYIHANETAKRIDFIFHSNGLQCIDYGIDMEGIPGSKHHFSDHKGVRSTFVFTGKCKGYVILCSAIKG